MKRESEVAQSYPTPSDPMDTRQEYWSGVPLPSPLIHLELENNLANIAIAFVFEFCCI